ncbi:uncharacterized protein EKO05_0007674 [Ascochyta rabiei]|nr:uncharacterized protein EKO05_0007674 [Ascochyta rabiei]UPX17309.1 hypothetical protein EKO05_0007674 [Ascochyta rabiei]
MTHAGSGTYGDVYFCLPSSMIMAARNHLTAQADLTVACDDLTKQLVAIKICQGPSLPTLKNELAVLQIIATTNHAPTVDTACGSTIAHCDAFFLSLDHETSPSGDTHYFTTATLPLVCSLDVLLSETQHLPEPFTWLVYVKIREALTWLMKCCKPGIAHGDLHPGNILIGYPTLDPRQGQQLPQVKMIDFGNSRIANAETGYAYALLFSQTVHKDRTAFLHLLALVVGVMSFDGHVPSRSPSRSPRLGGGESSAEFRQFCRLVQRAVKRSTWNHGDDLVELESRFKGYAERKLRGLDGEKCKMVWDAVMNGTEEQREAVRRRVGELVGVVVEGDQ